MENMVHRGGGQNANTAVRISDDDSALSAANASADKATPHAVAEQRALPGETGELGNGLNHRHASLAEGSEGRGKMDGEVGDGDADREDVRTRLRIAKMLSFTSGAGMVAWNKFASLWLLSVGLSPTQVGVLKTTGLAAKSVCQPVWALLADFKVPARIHPSLAPASLHCIAIFSGILSLLFMELLHRTAGRMAFAGILIIRTIWCMVNSGSQLVDALVAHMSHKTKEGFGRQRLWGSIAWGSMSLVAGALIDRFGLDALFTYTFLARTVMMSCLMFAMFKIIQGQGEAFGASLPLTVADKVSEDQIIRRIVPLLNERPQLGVLLAVVTLNGFIMVIAENVVSIQMDRDFKMSRTLNGFASTVGIIASVPLYYHSKRLLEMYGHFPMLSVAQGLTALMYLLHSLITKDYALLILPVCAMKGGILALFWSASVDLMQNVMDANLQSTGQTALSWMYYTIGGGIGHTFWSAYYQHRGASETYLLGAAVALGNMGLLRLSLKEVSRRTNARAMGYSRVAAAVEMV